MPFTPSSRPQHRLRPLNLPQRVDVCTGPDGWPDAIIINHKRKPIEALGEIWRVDDEWWRNPISRTCIEVMLTGGAHLILFQDHMTDKWYVQKP